MYRDDGLDQLPEDLQESLNKNDNPVQDTICYTYVFYEKFADSYYWLTSLSVIVFNSLFYAIVEPMI
jgi:hypothetical protein